MDHHVDTGVWCLGWLSFVFIYTILALIYYFIEIWPYENDNDINDNNDSDIYVINNENNTDIFVINFYYSDSDNEDIQ